MVRYNAGSREAAQWFVELCRMVAAGHAPRGGTDETTRRILQFAEQKCRLENGGRISARALYDAFTVQQLFVRVMSGRYVQRKRGGQSFYFGVKLAACSRLQGSVSKLFFVFKWPLATLTILDIGMSILCSKILTV